MRKFALFTLLLLIIIPAQVSFGQADFDCGTSDTVTITYVGDPTGVFPTVEQAVIERFEALCPNITVERIEGVANSTDQFTQYLTAFEAQSSDYDVIRIDVIWPGQLAPHLLDLTPYVSQEQIDSFIPATIQNDTVDGKIVALPVRIGFGLLYYRADLLEKYGFDAPPATWEELAEQAQTIQEGERAEGNAEFWGYVWQGNAYEGLTANALEWQASEGGGLIINPDGEIEVNNEATVQALERAASWIDTISPPGVTGYDENASRAVWEVGNAAFLRFWPAAYTLSLQAEAIADKFAVAPLPAGASGEGASALGGWQIGVSRYTEHPEAAAAFARYFASAENIKPYAIETSTPPAILSLYSDADIQAALPFASEDIVTITTQRPSTVTGNNYNAVSTLYFNAVHSVLTGEQDAEEALQLLELDLEQLLGE